MDQRTVAVVGSGASGLAAAFRLQEAGYRVRLLERGPKPGGRMSTVQRDGFLIEEGPSGLTRGHRSILGIIEDAGIGDELVDASSLLGIADRGDDIYLLDAHHIVRDGLRTKLISGRTKLALLRLVADLFRYRSRIDAEDMSGLAGIDHLSAEQYARRRYGDEAFEKVIDPCIRPLVIGHSEKLSAADLIQVFNAFMANQEFVAFRGGMGSYPALLAPLFDTTLNAEVLAVTEGPNSVRVSWRDAAGATHEETVAGVVIACDAQAAERMHPGLDAHRRTFLRDRVKFQPLVHVNVAMRKDPGTKACYVFPVARHHPRLVALTFEHNKVSGRAPDGKGIVGIYPTPEWSDQLFDEDDDVIAKNLINEAEAILPGLGSDIEFTHLTRVTPAVMNSYPGYWTAMADFRHRCASDRRIQLAGDYFCVSSVNGASAAGERAARALVAATS
jgi:oxygen-dependent protoporphyrinogen oxidase